MRAAPFLILLLLAASASADTIQFRCSLDANGTMVVEDVIFLRAQPIPQEDIGDYCLALTDLDTPKKLGEDCFEPNFVTKGERNLLFEAMAMMWRGKKPQYDELCGGSDCDDASVEVNPGAGEDCTDGMDNNCDERIDTIAQTL